MKMNLEGFKPVALIAGAPYISVTRNGISFNKSCLAKMDFPSDIIFMINAEKKMVAIQKCNPEDENAIAFFRKSSKKNAYVRWNNQDLLSTISNQMTWNLDEKMYKIDGQYIPEENAMIFDLNKASESDIKSKKSI